MTTPLIVLFASLVLLYIGIRSLIAFWVCVTCFWGRVAFKSPGSITYDFKPGGIGLVSLVLGLAGTLWSIIVLALLFV